MLFVIQPSKNKMNSISYNVNVFGISLGTIEF